MSAPEQTGTRGLFTYDFTVLTLAAAFGFCNIAVFYGLSTYLERIGVDPAWRGTVIAAEPLAAFLARPILSLLLTPRHALTLARLSMAGLGLALSGYQFAHGLADLLAVRVIHGLSFVCLVSAVTVLLARSVPSEFAGRAFGYFSLSSLIPYALMPPLTEWLLPHVGGEPQAYAWTALLVLPSLALMIPLGARLGPKTCTDDESRRHSLRDIRANLGRAPILLLLGTNLLVFSATTQVFFFIKPYALSLGGIESGLFFTISTVASIAVRLLAGPYYDRLPRRLAAMLATLALGVCMVLFPQTSTPALFFVLAGAYGMCLGVALPLVNASMFLESPPHLRGMNMNLMLFMMDAGYVLGPLAGGAFLARPGGFGGLFLFCAVCALAGAALLTPLGFREFSVWRGNRNGRNGS